MRKVYQQIAGSFSAYLNCIKTNNIVWEEIHFDRINEIVEGYLPKGSGFDCGTKFDFTFSKPDKLVFFTDYHHMDENGMYDGWSEGIKIVVFPSLVFGFDLKITGIRKKNRYDIDYFYDTFYNALNQEVKES